GLTHPLEIPYPFDIQVSRWQRSYTNSHTTDKNRTVVWLTHENSRGEILDLDWFGKCQLVYAEDFRVNPRYYHRQVATANNSSGSGVGSDGYNDAKPFGPSKKLDMAVVNFDLPLLRPREGSMQLDVFDGTGKQIARLNVPYPKVPNMLDEDW